MVSEEAPASDMTIVAVEWTSILYPASSGLFTLYEIIPYPVLYAQPIPSIYKQQNADKNRLSGGLDIPRRILVLSIQLHLFSIYRPV